MTIPFLSEESKNWLRDTLTKSYKDGHEWLDKLTKC